MLVYPIVIGPSNVPVLSELAAVTGGHAVLVRDARRVEATLAGIARELRFQYLLGYSPPAARGPSRGGTRCRSSRGGPVCGFGRGTVTRAPEP